jgi:hypothetical protein
MGKSRNGALLATSSVRDGKLGGDDVAGYAGIRDFDEKKANNPAIPTIATDSPITGPSDPQTTEPDNRQRRFPL